MIRPAPMDDVTDHRPPAPDAAFFRERLKQRVYAELTAFFAEEARRSGLTKAELAKRLHMDKARVTRLLASPSNMTLETISDLLAAMGAEADPPKIVRIEEGRGG